MTAAASRSVVPGSAKPRPLALTMLSSSRKPWTPTVSEEAMEPSALLQPYVAPASSDTEAKVRSRRLSWPVASPGVKPMGWKIRCWFERLSVPTASLAERLSPMFQRAPADRMKRFTDSSISGMRKTSSASGSVEVPEKLRASPTSKVVSGSAMAAPLNRRWKLWRT